MMGAMVGAGVCWVLGPIILVAVGVGGIFSLRSRQMGLRSPTSSTQNPLETLKLRLVRGEIDSDTYEEIRTHLFD